MRERAILRILNPLTREMHKRGKSARSATQILALDPHQGSYSIHDSLGLTVFTRHRRALAGSSGTTPARPGHNGIGVVQKTSLAECRKEKSALGLGSNRDIQY